MLGTPVDTWYVWIGVSVVALAILGVALSLPATAPPDAVGPAETIDRTVAHPYPATAEHPIDAAEVRIGPHELELRTGGESSVHRFTTGPVTPALTDDRLESILYGAVPSHFFGSPAAFEQAAIDAQLRDAGWHSAGEQLIVRTVHWEGVDVTLVGM